MTNFKICKNFDAGGGPDTGIPIGVALIKQ